MRLILLLILILVPLLIHAHQHVPAQAQTIADPPFWGTIFIDPDIVTPDDPTAFVNLTYAGQGMRTMYDRRVNNWIEVNAFLFDAVFDDALTSEIQVNPEFGTMQSAMNVAEKYAPALGQLSTSLRKDMQTVWIHKGKEAFGGGNFNILIHDEQGDEYMEDGILEETLIHESAHTSLDSYYDASEGWLAAQSADTDFISNYARDYPNREDMAESLVPYFAIRYRPERISKELYDIIVETIPNRIAYFDSLKLDMHPQVSEEVSIEEGFDALPSGVSLFQNYPNPFNPTTTLSFSLASSGSIRLSIYNALGNEIAVLEEGVFPAGKFTSTWEAGSLSSGIYFYRLVTGDFVQTKKMLLLK